MRKFKHIFLLAASVVFFAGCLKNSDQVTGPAGAQGSTGAPGGSFLQYHSIYPPLSSSSLKGIGPQYFYTWNFNGYNPNTTYMFSVYVSKINALGQTTVWNKLPYANVYEAGDNLSASLTKDTVKVCYTNSNNPFPDSTMACTIIVIPQQ